MLWVLEHTQPLRSGEWGESSGTDGVSSVHEPGVGRRRVYRERGEWSGASLGLDFKECEFYLPGSRSKCT